MTRPVLLAALLVSTFAACSQESPSPDSGAPLPVAMFLVEGKDDMQFTVRQLEVKAGQPVKLTLKNIGQMPKAAMGHNLVVLRQGVAAQTFGLAIATSGKGTLENGHLPDEFKKDVLAHTKLLGPGEFDTIEFTAPPTPCTLEYVCTFPGHFALMNGKIIVE